MNPDPRNGTTYPAPPPPRGGSGRREKVIFEINAPVAITLEREPPSFSTPGNWGEQFMYSLEGNRVAFVEPEVHDAILAQHGQEGDTFTITKCKDGRRNVWSVIRGDVAEQAARAIQAPAPAPAPTARAGRERASTPAIDARIAEAEAQNAARRAAQPAQEAPRPPAPGQTGHVSQNVMQACLCAAIEATHQAAAFAEGIGATYRPTSEDVRAIAISMYIEITGSGSRKR